MIENLVTWLKLAAHSRGQPIVLFDCPDAAADPSKAAKIKQLNAMLAQKPSMPMPPGFYVAKEPQSRKSYKVHDRTRGILGDARACSLEVIDDLLFETFGLHILEPIVEVVEVPVAKLQIAKLPPSSNSNVSSKLNLSQDTEAVSEYREFTTPKPKFSRKHS